MTSDRVRLFIALWPDEPVRSALRARRDAWAWPRRAAPTKDAHLHATLHFLGDQPASLIDPLQQALQAQRYQPFVLVLSRASLWHGGIAVLEPEQTPGELTTLHDELGRRLQALGITPERRAYRPHVTLARRAFGAQLPQGLGPLPWSVDRVALVWSDPGPPSTYRILAG
jgi:2'-5' RNA ligase